MNNTSIGRLFWMNQNNDLNPIMTSGTAFVMNSSESKFVVSARHCFEKNSNIPENLVNLVYVYYSEDGRPQLVQLGSPKAHSEFDLCRAPIQQTELHECGQPDIPIKGEDVFVYGYRDDFNLGLTEPLLIKTVVSGISPRGEIILNTEGIQGFSGGPVIGASSGKVYSVFSKGHTSSISGQGHMQVMPFSLTYSVKLLNF